MARADDAMLDLGRHLVALAENGFGDGARGMVVNGQVVSIRVFSTSQDIETVLDFYDGWCRGGSGEFAEQEEELFVVDETIAPTAREDDRSWRDLTARGVEDDLGYVGCIKHGIPGARMEDLSNRVLTFLDSGNLKDLGQFHYAAATRIGDATRVIAVWTSGDFFPGEMFPTEGDAPGFDAAGISRPPSGTRMLSAGEIGHSQTLTVYVQSEHSLAELRQFYRRDFVRREWRILADEQQGDSLHYFVVQRGSEMRVVAVSQEPGEMPSVTIASTD